MRLNVVREFPIQVFIPYTTWEAHKGYRDEDSQKTALIAWVKAELSYPHDCRLFGYRVMDYMCFRFKNVGDAAFFRLTWF